MNDSSASDRITRRGFHSLAVGAASAAMAGGLISTGVARTQQDVPPAGNFIDIHVHLGQQWNERGELTPQMMLNWMDEHNISQAVVLPLISPESWFYPMTTQWVLEQTAPHRDRLIPFCSVDPRTPNLGGYEGFLDILRRYQDAGARGFGEHKWGGPIDDPKNIELMRACSELKLPVLFHLDAIRNTDKPGLPGLEKVLEAAPDAAFIGHANGWWASISGDVTQSDMGRYPAGAVQPGGAIDRLMDKYSNLYGDISAGSGANAIQRDATFGREFVIRRADRLLFGTDYLADGQQVPQFDLIESLDLPNDVLEKICRVNARRLLGIET
jgi:uncharacterized protein